MKSIAASEFIAMRKLLLVVFVPAIILWIITLVLDLAHWWHAHDVVRRAAFVVVPTYYAAVSLIIARHKLPEARARRRAAGLCPSRCYDLRASKDRCPESGRAIEQQN